MTLTDDRADILSRGRRTRSVRKPDAHLLVAERVQLTDVPDPYESTSTSDLSDIERSHLEICEQAIGQLQSALTTAGKALATVNSARLYRETHGTFEQYVEERWGMKRSHAYRMIDAWPIAAALSPIGDINEAQVRELVPVAKRHGMETAVTVYSEVHSRNGGRVTAAQLHDAVKILPSKVGSPEEARGIISEASNAGVISLGSPRKNKEDQEDVPRGSVGALYQILERQKKIYDELGGGLADAALLEDPNRAAYLLREIKKYAQRTSHRSQTQRTKRAA